MKQIRRVKSISGCDEIKIACTTRKSRHNVSFRRAEISTVNVIMNMSWSTNDFHSSAYVVDCLCKFFFFYYLIKFLLYIFGVMPLVDDFFSNHSIFNKV